MDLTQIKLIMLKDYEKQINNLFDIFKNNVISLDNFVEYFNKLNHIYNFSRIDIKNNGFDSNKIHFIEYGKSVNLSFPNWFCDEFGQGCKIEWKLDDLNIIFSCIDKGTLKIILRGMDFKNLDNERIPIYINFKKLSINNEEIFKENTLVWHNKPYIFEKKCENDEVIYLDLEIDTLFDFFPQLNIQINKGISQRDLLILFDNLINYIEIEKSLLKSVNHL